MEEKRIYFSERKQWRKWLSENFDKEKEIWLIYPKKSSGKKRIEYNDAVEEALCFGWIDSTVRTLDEDNTIQRFTPRNPKSSYSQPNKERLRWLSNNKMLHPKIQERIAEMIKQEYVFPKDIISKIKEDKETWENFQKFPETYKRIRVAYVDDARERPEEFEKRLKNFLKKTKENKMIGFGGIDKYY